MAARLMVASLKPDKERRTGEFRGFHRFDAAGIILSAMSSPARFRESRRSCRVPLTVVIAIEDGAEGRTSEGDHRGHLHGVLLATAIGLTTGMGISIHV